MKKQIWLRSVPVLVAVFCLVFYQLLYRPQRHSPEMIVSVLLFFTALAWSALIFLSLERRHWLRFLYALIAVSFSVFLVEGVRFFPETLPLQRLIYGCNLLGIAIIEFYMRILRKEQKESR
jgi:hypothetical protein